MNRKHLVGVSRRSFVQHVVAGATAGFISCDHEFFVRRVFAQAAGKTSDDLLPPNRFSRMVQEWFVGQVRSHEDRANVVRNSLSTRADAEKYVQSVRERIRLAFGPEPARTPLNAKITGIVERDTYRIEKVVFESRPQFFVTANLYVPAKRNFPAPAVVGSCGHSTNGKAAEAYQSFAQGLARQGYVVLIYDPIGQGERLQYTDEQFKPRRGVGVSEHLYAGNQQVLVGEFFGMWRAWDGIRALDYLLTRPEVDARHVGITGNSGGGTLTTWLCGLDSRWTMAAPGCFVTTFRRNVENELPADTEQCPPRAIALGLDHSDFLAALAPKPVIILAKERDYFDVRGSLEAYERLKQLYSLLAAPENIALHIGPTEHGYSIENREAMYSWFNRAVGNSTSATGIEVTKEPALSIESDEALQCVPKGQVAELASRTVYSYTKELSIAHAKSRKPLEGDALRTAVRQILRLPAIPQSPPDYRILRPLRNRKYPLPAATTYAIETEKGIHSLVIRLSDKPHLSRPPNDAGPAILYVAHHSADAELRRESFLREIIQQNPEGALYACDVRGIGESRPDTCGSDQFLSPYGSDYFYAAHSLMLDRPYVGQKTLDVLRVLQWLAVVGHRRIHLVGNGWGSLPATFASLLSESVNNITIHNGLESYSSLAENEEYDWPLSALLPGVLSQFDLPDCYRELKKAGKLSIIHS